MDQKIANTSMPHELPQTEAAATDGFASDTTVIHQSVPTIITESHYRHHPSGPLDRVSFQNISNASFPDLLRLRAAKVGLATPWVIVGADVAAIKGESWFGEFASLTHLGGDSKVINEDGASGVAKSNGATIFCVGDGMGSTSSADLAAQTFLRKFAKYGAIYSMERAATLGAFSLVRELNEHSSSIFSDKETKHMQDMGLCFIACEVSHSSVRFLHAGDCRGIVYRPENSEMIFATTDHSQREFNLKKLNARDTSEDELNRILAELGLKPEDLPLTEDETYRIKKRNVVRNCIALVKGKYHPGLDSTPEPSQSIMLQERDLVILCSDGLWENLREADWKYCLGNKLTPQDLAIELYDRAQKRIAQDKINEPLPARRNDDNITVLVYEHHWGG